MKTGFILDVDQEFASFAKRNLTLFEYHVHTFLKPDDCWEAQHLNPTLILIGESLSFNLDYVRQIRRVFPKAIIIFVAPLSEAVNEKSAKQAGATEFIEKNGAAFVRLRTCLDQVETAIQSRKNTLISKLKKAFSR